MSDSIWRNMFQVLKWTLLAATLLTTGTAASIVQTPAPQIQPGLVKVFENEVAFTADVGADGRLAVVFTRPYGTGTNQNPAGIEIRNLITRERITLAGGVSNVGTPGRPAAALSPDSKWVAYTWFDPELTDTGMLQVIGVESGAQPRTLIPADPSDIGIIPHGWSPDGKRILVLIHGPSVSMDRDPTSLAWVTVADGRMHTIKTLEPWRDGGSSLPRLSRDGRWMAYSAVARQGSTERAIYVVDAETGAERRIASVPGSSSSPVWSPDGSHVVFVNHQNGSVTSDLLALAVNAPTVGPILLETAFAGAPISITNAGTLYWMQFDFGLKGIVLQLEASGSRAIDEFSGYGVTWLRNERVGFIRNGSDVIVRTLDSQAERAYPHDSLPVLAPRVLEDGSAAVLHIPASGDDGRVGGGFYRLDFANSGFKRLFSRDDAGRMRSSVSALSPDNRTLYLGLLTGTPRRWSSVVAVDVDSGLERRRVPLPDSMPPVQGIAVSPDGTTVALHTSDGRLFTVGVNDGAVREVVGPSPGGGWAEVVRWSRDGQYIVYGTRSDPTSTTWRLMRVRYDGGDAEPAGVDSSLLSKPGQLGSFDLSPDNTRVALTVRVQPTFDVGAINGIVSRLNNPR